MTLLTAPATLSAYIKTNIKTEIRSGCVSTKPDAGFSLIEVIVALAVIAVGLAVFSQAMGGAYRAAQRTRLQTLALASAQSHLDSAGIDGVLAGGQTTGKYATGLPWRLSITPLVPPANPAIPDVAQSGSPQPVWIVVETFDHHGAPLVRLQTAKVVRIEP